MALESATDAGLVPPRGPWAVQLCQVRPAPSQRLVMSDGCRVCPLTLAALARRLWAGYLHGPGQHNCNPCRLALNIAVPMASGACALMDFGICIFC